MAYSICARCGKFFVNDGNARCSKCQDKYTKEYAIIREYISTHAGASAMDVNAVTGIPIKSILKFIDEGIISYTNDK